MERDVEDKHGRRAAHGDAPRSAGQQAAEPRYRKPFKPDKERILEAILFLIGRTSGLSQHEIVKSLFLADRAHLNTYGRPITFDNYVAMEHGPVPSLAYNALEPSFNFSKIFKEERPWVTIRDGNKNRFVNPKRGFRKDVLSKTDIDALESALQTIKTLSVSQIRRLTHDDPAYKEAWSRRGKAAAADMDMSKLLEDGDEETIERLAYLTRC